MTVTSLIYRVPEGSDDVMIAVAANLEAAGTIPLATVAARQQLWRRGGPSARLALRLNTIANGMAGVADV